MSQFTPPPVPKRGLSGLAIAGLGCLGLFLVVVALGIFIAVHTGRKYVEEFGKNPSKTGALLAIRTNPDLHVVRTDDAAGTVTMWDDEKGKKITVPFADITSGKYSVVNSKGQGVRINGFRSQTGPAHRARWKGGSIDDGNFPIGDPDWVPLYPGSAAMDNSVPGTIRLETSDSLAQVREFYERGFKEAGFDTEVVAGDATGTKSTDGYSAVITATQEAQHRVATVIVSRENDKTTVVVTYKEGKR